MEVLNMRDEMKKLAHGLIDKGLFFKTRAFSGGDQIIVYDEHGTRIWDAVSHTYSYGGDQGLIEILGTIVNNEDDNVEGYLTADDILSRL